MSPEISATPDVPATGVQPGSWLDRLALLFLLLLSGAMLLTNLGNHYLWQDEAQTALLSRSIVETGIPHGTDGTNFFSQELGVEYGEGYVWRWHTWLSFYAVAGSFILLDESAFSARLPFSLAGIATVLLCYQTGLALWRDRRAAFAGAAMLALCVPFCILSRQCRYYSLAALLSLLALAAYARLGPRTRRPAWLLFAAALLLFHTHYIYCATLLASILLHALLFERERLRTTLLVSAGVTILSAPWIVWLSSVELGGDYLNRLVSPSHLADTALQYAALTLQYFFFWGGFLLIPVFLMLERRVRGRRPEGSPPDVVNAVWLLAIYCGVNLILLTLLAPGVYVRYLAPLAAPLFLLIGLLVGQLMARSMLAAVAVVVLWLASGSIGDFLYELTHDYDGPIEGIVKHLQQHARPGERVAIVYGDMPLKFYTDLRVIGGLTGESLEDEHAAEWIVLRPHNVASISREVRRKINSFVTPAHRCRKLPYPDIPFENREDPRSHRFRTVEKARRVIVCGPGAR